MSLRHNIFIKLYSMTWNVTFMVWRSFMIFYCKTFWPNYNIDLRSYGQLLYLFFFVICWVWINGHAIMLMVLFLLNNVCWILLNTRKVNIILICGISDVDERPFRKIWQGKRLCIAQPCLWGIYCVAPFLSLLLFASFSLLSLNHFSLTEIE